MQQEYFFLDPKHNTFEAGKTYLEFEAMGVPIGIELFVDVVMTFFFVSLTLLMLVGVALLIGAVFWGEVEGNPILFCGLYLISLATTSFFSYIFIKEIKKYRLAEQNYPQLAGFGILLDGKITNLKAEIHSKSHKLVITIAYQFISPKGATCTGAQYKIREDLKGKPLPSVGTSVRVLYASEKNHILL